LSSNSAIRLSRLEAESLTSAGQPIVEREHRVCLGVLCCEQHAAVGQPQTSVGSKLCQSRGSVVAQLQRCDLQFGDRGSRRFEPAMPGRAHENLGQRQRAATEGMVSDVEQALDRSVVQRVSIVEVRDEDTRVDDDHSGQSLRSWSR
jgi:hypothetical protein